jgi:ketosteroid isomerase-like protein
MNRDTAIALLDRLHKAQNEFYAGGSGTALQQLVAPNITWTIPGDNRIAGTYRGLKEVLDYPAATRPRRSHVPDERDVLAGDGDRLAALTNGFATIRNVDQRCALPDRQRGNDPRAGP